MSDSSWYFSVQTCKVSSLLRLPASWVSGRSYRYDQWSLIFFDDLRSSKNLTSPFSTSNTHLHRHNLHDWLCIFGSSPDWIILSLRVLPRCRLQGPEMTAVLSYVAALCWSTGFTVSRSLNHWAFSLQSCRVKSQPGTKKGRDKWRESAGLIRLVTTKKSCYSTAKALSYWNLQDLRSRRRQIGFKQSRSKKSCKKLLPRKQSSWSLKAVEHAQRLPSWLSWTD